MAIWVSYHPAMVFYSLYASLVTTFVTTFVTTCLYYYPASLPSHVVLGDMTPSHMGVISPSHVGVISPKTMEYPHCGVAVNYGIP